ncbi:MAG: small multi-drug export protein [Thermoplasmata archaeon]|nr:small multi-drug export protein [Thermoplasmata archaeon]
MKMKINEFIINAYNQLSRIKSNLAILHKFLILIIPFLTIAYYFVFVSSILPPNAAAKYTGLVIAYFFPPAGKESVIPLMLSNQLGPPISPWIVGSTIIILDVISSAIIAYNWWFAEFIINHISILQRGYKWLQERAKKFKKARWLDMALLLFMIIPFQGTGGISTTIVARLLGLPARKTVAIVMAGSTITTSLWILWWLGFLSFIKAIFFISI